MFGSNIEGRLSSLEATNAGIQKDLAVIKDALGALVRAQKNSPQGSVGGGAIVPANVDRAIQSAVQGVEQRIYKQLNTHLIPVMKDQVQWLNYQTEDTQDQVTNYQLEQMLGTNGSGSLKQVSQGDKARLHMMQW